MEPLAARSGGGSENLISALPDELLHCILLRLPSVAAAARTSLLSRRWRHVWTHMPELILSCSRPDGGPAPVASVFLDSVDAVLNAYSAPTLRHFEIHMDLFCRGHLPAHRIARWLQFASRRLAGRLDFYLPMHEDEEDTDRELILPVLERATEIKLLLRPNIVLRLPPGGSFTALTDLRIMLSTMNGSELGRLVSSQCPRLRKLHVLVKLAVDFDVSIRSKSLVSFFYYAGPGKLEVFTPFLEKISVCQATEAYIVAPNLKKVNWHDNAYDPSCHRFAVLSRHLQRLWINETSLRLMKPFDTVNELWLVLSIPEGIEGYQSFLKDTYKVPICETLRITWTDHHAFAPTMLHLLGRSRCIRKLRLSVDPRSPNRINRCMMLGCPCHLPESYRADNITFDALEEIDIDNFTGSSEHKKFVIILLSRCNAATLKSLEITMSGEFIPSKIKGVCKEINSVCQPNCKVKFNVVGEMGLEPFVF